MRKRKPDNRKLSVYLMKEKYQDFGSILKGKPVEYEVKRGARTVGRLFVKALPGRCPAWFSLFSGNVQEGLREKLNNRIVSAVFLLKRKGRIFAITFGYGRSLLEQGTWEERFGLKVVLNSIDREKIRVIERKNIDTMLTQTRTQTSRKCAIEEFNLDVQQILLKAVLGEPREETFASSILGADALRSLCKITWTPGRHLLCSTHHGCQCAAHEIQDPFRTTGRTVVSVVSGVRRLDPGAWRNQSSSQSRRCVENHDPCGLA